MTSTFDWESGNGGQGLGSDTNHKRDPWISHFSCLGLSFLKIKLHGWLYVHVQVPSDSEIFQLCSVKITGVFSGHLPGPCDNGGEDGASELSIFWVIYCKCSRLSTTGPGLF